MGRAVIAGWAHSRFGRSSAAGTEELMAEVIPPALDHAGITAEDVDCIFVGVYNNGFTRQDFQGGLIGMQNEALSNTPATRYENACATGTAALYGAVDFIESGRGRIALVVGAEKMTGVPGADVGRLLLSGCYQKEEGETPNGFAGVFSSIAAEYFNRYGDHSTTLAHIAAKNHRHGSDNPFAHVRKDLGFDFCNGPSEENPYVAAPLRRTDCSLVSDGAAALIVAAADLGGDLRRAIGFRARAHANDYMALSRRDPLAFEGARRAWHAALNDASITLDDLDLVETHDCFTIAELLEYEAMGLAEPGQGARVVDEGWTTKEGRLPINLSGGLKARGHPLGATGVSMHVMLAMQLAGEAGEMQLPGATTAAAFNMGGAAVTNYVSILERLR
jgi:acetyl-CoA C-acetyltransferase